MTGSRKLCAAVITAYALMWSSAAWAEPTAQEKEKARQLMAEGRERRDKTELANALDSFKQADAIMHVPTTGYEVARTQQLLGQLVEARETVANIAKLPVNPTDPPPFAEARSKAEALGAELDKQIGQLKITVKANETKSTPTVTVDDVPLASIDTPARLNPGKHTLVARAEDIERRETFNLAPGETREIELQFDKRPGNVAPSPETKGRGIPTLSLVGFGVGAAGLAVGTVTGIMAMSDESDIADRCPNSRCTRDVESDLDSAKTKATISTIGFIVAGVGVAVGVVGFFVTPKTEAKVGKVTFDFARMRGSF